MITASGTRPATALDGSSTPVEVALVNTMPDSAFEETERQFTRLVHAGAHGLPVDLSLYSIPVPGRRGVIRRLLADRYQGLDALYRRRPEAVIVTGSEPRRPDLRDEAYWDDLAGLIRWARASTSSLLLSCLAAHAALLAVDGVARQRLATKHSGVYPQSVHPSHPLGQGLGSVAFPHSRLHDVPPAVVEAHGYTVVLRSPAVGWTVAAKDTGCLVVLFQGHPEYSPTTLLREYRRDVRRHLTGQVTEHPVVPTGYLDVPSVALLEAFRPCSSAGRDDPTGLESFPFERCAQGIVADWQGQAERLVGNWLAEVAHRRVATAGRRAG